MIIHFHNLQCLKGGVYWLLTRNISRFPVICRQNLNEDQCWSEGFQPNVKPTVSTNEESCCKRSQYGCREWRGRSLSSRQKQVHTNPHSSALQGDSRDVALMKALVDEGCIPSYVLDRDTKSIPLGESPALFHVETSLIQSLQDKVSDLRDLVMIPDRLERRVAELTQKVHVESVMGSAVPCSKNSDDIIIRANSEKGATSTERGTLLERIDRGRSSLEDSTHKTIIPNICSDGFGGHPLLRCSVAVRSGQDSKADGRSEGPSDGPNKEQLELMFHRLSEEMPTFFEHSHDYSMYSHDLEFDNRLMGVKTKGLVAYKATVQSLKLASTAYLVNAHLEVLRLTMDPEQGCIHARWRLKGVPLHSYALRPFAKKHKFRYFDAFSIFRVGPDGLITHHRLDKVMPDSEKVKEPSLLTKIGIALGLVRQPAIGANWTMGEHSQV